MSIYDETKKDSGDVAYDGPLSVSTSDGINMLRKKTCETPGNGQVHARLQLLDGWLENLELAIDDLVNKLQPVLNPMGIDNDMLADESRPETSAVSYKIDEQAYRVRRATSIIDAMRARLEV